MNNLNRCLARYFLAVAICDGTEERQLVQRISDDFGDEGVLWRPRRVRDYLEVALNQGRCFRLPIRGSSNDRCSHLYYPDPYHAIKWLAAHPDWVAQPSGSLSEALGISEEIIEQCRAGTFVYAVYGGRLAVVEPGLLLGEIGKRCERALGLPATWGAHRDDGEDVLPDYRTKAGDVIGFREEIRLPGFRTAWCVTTEPPEEEEPAKTPSPKSPPACYHSANEDPPEPYRNNGPLEGTKTYLAALAYAGSEANYRNLDSLIREGFLWGQRMHKRRYRIWFRQEHHFLSAKKADDNRQHSQEKKDSK